LACWWPEDFERCAFCCWMDGMLGLIVCCGRAGIRMCPVARRVQEQAFNGNAYAVVRDLPVQAVTHQSPRQWS
jgi:hypothetical protein